MKKVSKLQIIGLLALSFALAPACASKKPASAGGAGTDGSDSGAAGSGGTAGGSGAESMAGITASTVGADGKLTAIYFDFDKASLDEQARNTLKGHYKMLNKDAKSNIVIEGHCDDRGTTEYNLALGERRAKAVKDYLANLGVSPKRLSTISYGEERPAISGDDESTWAKNRRGEFLVTPK